MLRFGKRASGWSPSNWRETHRSGDSEIWAESKESEHRWRLQFELRERQRSDDAETVGGDQRRSCNRRSLIPQSFGLGICRLAPARLEQALSLGQFVAGFSIRYCRLDVGTMSAGLAAPRELRWLNLRLLLASRFDSRRRFRVEQAAASRLHGTAIRDQIKTKSSGGFSGGACRRTEQKSRPSCSALRNLLPRGSETARESQPAAGNVARRCQSNCCHQTRPNWAMN